MKIDTEHYVVKDSEVDPKKDVCAGTTFSESDEPILDKRSVKKRPEAHDSVLIVSSFPKSSAQNLCAHSNSMGPDFVSLEEKTFCDMDAKQLYLLCDVSLPISPSAIPSIFLTPSQDVVTSDCFNLETSTLAGPANGGKSATINISPYKNIVSW